MGDLKELMIAAGMKFVRENGIDGISMRKIANSCGVSHAAMYRYFENKDDFVKEIIKRISRKFAKQLMKGTEGITKSDETLTIMGMNFIEFSRKYSDFYELLFLSKYVIPARNEEGKLRTDEQVEAFSVFKDEVYKFLRENGITKEQDIIVIQLWSFISGLAMIVNKGDLLASDELLKEIIRAMIEKFKKN